MSSLTLLAWIWGVMSVAMGLLWMWQQRRQDASSVDVAWSAGVGFAALTFALMGQGDHERRLALALFALSWSMRLTAYLYLDRLRGKPEDGRYRELRQQWGSKAGRNFFLFFQFQALLVPLFALPFVAVAQSPEPLSSTPLVLAAAIWLASLIGESVADRQLAAFRRNPVNQGKSCRDGLWRYSRHPNYFFEWLHWFAYVALCIGTANFFWSLSGPLVMLLFLFKVTGIPANEARALKSRGDDYRDYQRTTSTFIPWWPKSR